jgi:hypothetical protein
VKLALRRSTTFWSGILVMALISCRDEKRFQAPEEKAAEETRRTRLSEGAKKSTEALRKIRDRPLEERADPSSAFESKDDDKR